MYIHPISNIFMYKNNITTPFYKELINSSLAHASQLRGFFMSTLQRIALVFTVIGAVNWGLIGFFQFDLVAAIFGGQNSALARIIYGIVGISGLINLGFTL